MPILYKNIHVENITTHTSEAVTSRGVETFTGNEEIIKTFCNGSNLISCKKFKIVIQAAKQKENNIRTQAYLLIDFFI